MGKKKYEKNSADYTENKKQKIKDKCCEKHIRKGKHCKSCPLRGECELPE